MKNISAAIHEASAAEQAARRDFELRGIEATTSKEHLEREWKDAQAHGGIFSEELRAVLGMESPLSAIARRRFQETLSFEGVQNPSVPQWADSPIVGGSPAAPISTGSARATGSYLPSGMGVGEAQNAVNNAMETTETTAQDGEQQMTIPNPLAVLSNGNVLAEFDGEFVELTDSNLDIDGELQLAPQEIAVLEQALDAITRAGAGDINPANFDINPSAYDTSASEYDTGAYDTGAYDTGAYDTGAYDEAAFDEGSGDDLGSEELDDFEDDEPIGTNYDTGSYDQDDVVSNLDLQGAAMDDGFRLPDGAFLDDQELTDAFLEENKQLTNDADDLDELDQPSDEDVDFDMFTF